MTGVDLGVGWFVTGLRIRIGPGVDLGLVYFWLGFIWFCLDPDLVLLIKSQGPKM